MAELASLVVRLTGDISKFSSSMDAAAQKMRQVGASMTNIGQNMTLGVTAPLALAGVAAVKAASDLEESMNKVSVVFGESASEVQKWATTTADAFGISQQQALEATGTFGNLFRAMGMGQGPAAEMSQSLVELAADLASFNNIPIDVALEKLRAGLVGEVEPLRTLGVQMNAAAVTAKALEMGLAGSAKELTEADKVTARYALIMEQTALAQGDFTRTSDGLANSTRILRAMMGDLASQIGQVLIPVATTMAVRLREVLNTFLWLSPEIRQAIVIVAGLAAAIGPLLMIVGRMTQGFALLVNVLPMLAGPFGIILGIVAALVGGFALLVQQTGSVDGALSALGINVNQLAGIWEFLKIKVGQVVGAIQSVVQEVFAIVSAIIGQSGAEVGDLSTVWQSAVTLIVQAIGQIGTFLTTVFGGIATFLREHRTEIVSAVGGAWESISSTISQVVSVVGPLIDGFVSSVVGWFQDNWPAIQQTVETVFNAVQSVVTTVVGAVSSFVLQEFGVVIEWVKQNWPLIQQTIETVLSAIMTVVTSVVSTIQRLWTEHGENIKRVIGTLWDNVKTIIDSALRIILGIIRAVMQVINGDWRGAWETIKTTFETVWTNIKNSLGKTIGLIREIIENVMQKIATWIDTKLQEIKQWFIDRWNAIKSFLQSIDLAEIGRNIIQGLINGVVSMAQSLIASITGVINDAIAAAKRLLGISSPSRVMADEVGKPLIEGILVGAREAQPGAQSGITNIVSAILESVTDMMSNAGGATIGGSLGALIQFVSDFVRAFQQAISWFVTASANAKAQAEAFVAAAQGMIDTLLKAIELLSSLGGIRIPADGAAFVRPLAQFLSDLIQEMYKTISWVTTASANVKAQAEAFAAAALDLLGTLTASVELIKAVGNIRLTTNVEGFLYRLVGLISNIVQLMAQRIAPLTMRALAAVRVFSDAAKPVLEVMKQAVDTINALGDVKIRDLAKQIAYIADRIVGMTNNIRRVAEYLGTRGVEAARKFAEAAGPVLEAMKKAVDAINGVQTIQIMDVSQQVAYMADRIIGMTFQLKRVAGYMSEKSVRAAAEFAAAVAPVLTIIKSAVDAIADLQTLPRDLPDLKPAIRALSDMLAALTTALRQIAEDVGVSAAKAAAEFATAVGPVVSIVKNAVEALTSLASLNVSPLEDRTGVNMQALSDFIYALAIHLSEVAAAVDLTLLKVASELADIIRKPFEMIKLAIDVFNAVAGWNVSTGVFDKLDTLISHIWNVLRKIRAIRDPFTEEVMGDIKWIVENVIPALQMLQDAMLMISNIGRIDLSGLAVVAYNSGVNWIHALADGIRGGLSYLESALQAVANLFPHSPAKTGPLRREPDWSTWMLAGFREAWHDAGALASSLPPIAGVPGSQMMPASAPVYNVTIHNPRREAAEDSLRRELMFLAAGVA